MFLHAVALMQPVAVAVCSPAENEKKKTQNETEKHGKRKPQRNPQNKTANDNQTTTFHFQMCLQVCVSIFRWVRSLLLAKRYAANWPLQQQQRSSSNIDTTATTFHFVFHAAHAKIKRSNQTAKLAKDYDRESNPRNRYKNYGIWFVINNG